MMRRGIAYAVALTLLGCATAHADWNGDGAPDVIALDGTERVLLYRSTGAGAFVLGGGIPIGSGWGTYDTVLAPGDTIIVSGQVRNTERFSELT